jgi:hypothetical protein
VIEVELVIKCFIDALYDYNEKVVYCSPQSSPVVSALGAINAYEHLLKEAGYPASAGTGKIWSSTKGSVSAYTYLMVKAGVIPTDVLNTIGFENGIYWLVDGYGKSTKNKRRW